MGTSNRNRQPIFYNTVLGIYERLSSMSADQWKDLSGIGSGGNGGGLDRFGIEDTTSEQDRNVDMQRNKMELFNASEWYFSADDVDGKTAYMLGKFDGDGNAYLEITISNNTNEKTQMFLHPVKGLQIVGGATGGGVREFADNAAALSGGLVVGNMYHTAGNLKIVI